MCWTYGSVDLGIIVPSSFIRSLILNLRLLSTVDKNDRQKQKNILITLSGLEFESLRRQK